jgi:hypothetical protein
MDVIGWLDVTQNRDRLWAVVNKVMNLLVPYSVGNFMTS